MDVAVGSDVVDVLSADGVGVGVERAVDGGSHVVAGEEGEVVATPVAGGEVETLVDVAVDTDVVDVLLG